MFREVLPLLFLAAACGGTARTIATPGAPASSKRFPLGDVKFAPNQFPKAPSPRHVLIVGTGPDTSTFLPLSAASTAPSGTASAGEQLARFAVAAYLGVSSDSLGVPAGAVMQPAQSGVSAVTILAKLTDSKITSAPASGAVLADGTWLSDSEASSLLEVFAGATGERLPASQPIDEAALAVTAAEQEHLGKSYDKVRAELLTLWPKLLAAQTDLTTPRAVQRLANRALIRAKSAEGRRRVGDNVMALERLRECAASAAVAGWLSGWTPPPAGGASATPLSPARAYILASRGQAPPLAMAPTLATVPPSIRDEVSETDPAAIAASAAQRTGVWAATLEAILSAPDADPVARGDQSNRASAEFSAHLLSLRALEDVLGIVRDPLTGVAVQITHAEVLEALVTATEASARRHAQRARLATGQVPLLVRYHYQAGKAHMESRQSTESKVDAVEAFLYASLFARLAEANAR